MMRPLNHSIKSFSIAATIVMMIPFFGFAQSSTFWLDARTGPSTFGGSLQGSLDYQTSSHILQVRYIWAGELMDFSAFGTDQKDEAQEMALLYGRFFQRDNIRISASAGVSYVDIKDYELENTLGSHGNSQLQRYQGFGFPAEIDLSIQLAPSFAISTSLFTNFNKQKTLAGIGIGLQFGALGSRP